MVQKYFSARNIFLRKKFIFLRKKYIFSPQEIFFSVRNIFYPQEIYFFPQEINFSPQEIYFFRKKYFFPQEIFFSARNIFFSARNIFLRKKYFFRKRCTTCSVAQSVSGARLQVGQLIALESTPGDERLLSEFNMHLNKTIFASMSISIAFLMFTVVVFTKKSRLVFLFKPGKCLSTLLDGDSHIRHSATLYIWHKHLAVDPPISSLNQHICYMEPSY